MIITPAAIKMFLETLAATPSRLDLASRDIENARLHFKSDQKFWSANDILAHLRACADVWGKSIAAMLEQDHPTLRYVSPRAWIRKTDYPKLELRASLLAFTGQRAELLKQLDPLAFEDWSRGASFTDTTLGRTETVFSYTRRMALHESDHCEQIEALLK